MQPHKPTEQIAEHSRSVHRVGALVGVCLLLACSRPESPQDEDSQDSPDPSNEPTEYEGILHGLNYGAAPTQFWECESGEVFEMTYVGQLGELWKGSCYGAYNRVHGELDRSFDPPRLIIDEVLEARWCGSDECSITCEPMYESCYEENEVVSGCDPLPFGCEGNYRCNPVRFHATQDAGWMHDLCHGKLGGGVDGDPCEYPDDGVVDTCDDGYRCWNAAGDLSSPGVCVPYCDPTGNLGTTCTGTCVHCSGNEWGLCISECSGEDCNVDDFC
jgi:hypothetical protein